LESRRVILLTEGFLNGWLDFKYNTRFSKLREEYILTYIERKQATEAIKLKSIIDACLASGKLTAETASIAYETFEKYIDLTLPYAIKKDKISNKVITKEELGDLKLLLQKGKEMLGKNV